MDTYEAQRSLGRGSRRARPATVGPGRFRLLFLLSFPPRLDAHHGGRAIAELVAGLVERHDVAVLYLRRTGEPGPDALFQTSCELLEEVTLDGSAPTSWRGRGRFVLGVARNRPELVSGAASRLFARRVREITRAWKPEIVQIELEEMGQYAPDVRVGSPAARLVLTIHDPGLATADQQRRRNGASHSRMLRSLEAHAWERYEPRALRSVDAIVALTERDRGQLADGVDKVVVIPLGTKVPPEPLNPYGQDDGSIVFVGGYAHRPNAEAAHRLATAIFPLVRRRVPGAALYVVGAEPTRELLRLQQDGVVVTGTVDSVRPYLDRANVVALPVRLGGGMRVKSLEALAAGKAIVASGLALAGLDVVDGRDVLVAESDAEFAEKIVRVLGDPELRVSLAANARRFAVEHLSWDQRIQEYEGLYASLARPG